MNLLLPTLLAQVAAINPGPVGARLSMVAMILCVIILATLIYLATKLSGRTLAIILGGGCLALVVAYLAARVSYREVIPGVERPVDVVVNNYPPGTESTAELWDKLTRSRIQLDDVKIEAQDSTEDSEPKENDSKEETETAEQSLPDWVDYPSIRTGNIYRQVVVSDPFSTVDGCFADLEGRFQRVVRVRMQRLLNGLPGSPFAIPEPSKLGIGLDYIMSKICRVEHSQTVDFSVGEMQRVYVLMEFDSEIDDHLRSSWQRYERVSRLKTVGGIAGLSLGGLAMVFGLLKFDTWTRGYYTKRLLIGVPAAIIVLVLLFVS